MTVDNDLLLYSDDIINNLTERFEDFIISKSQLNNHLRNTILITVKKKKKTTFEPKAWF
ncbi:hypothetical protein BDF21DRAFT_390764 [Thamnidium elegans]|nr:hypothetical protein BDF21DRAFT_390764 [Thamnidium elegans]